MFGSNLRYIANECNMNIDMLTPSSVKNEMTYFDCPANEVWRVELLRNIINIRTSEMFLENFDDNELENILEHICLS